MKKISALLLAVVMAFGMAGCSDSGSSDSDNESSAAAVQTESSAADSSEDATATTTTTTTAPAVTESSQAEVADTSTADENKPASGDSNDIAASAIEPSETSEENLAPIGQWIKTTRYCATDKIYHTIYTRITKVVYIRRDYAPFIAREILRNIDLIFHNAKLTVIRYFQLALVYLGKITANRVVKLDSLVYIICVLRFPHLTCI